MKTLEDFQQTIQILLGDASARRYSDVMLNSALRATLEVYAQFVPTYESVNACVCEIKKNRLRIPYVPCGGQIIHQVFRTGSCTEEIICQVEPASENGSTWMIVAFRGSSKIRLGETLRLWVSASHTIAGLGTTSETTVYDSHFMLFCEGASGFAMQMRANMITEIFGKRSEDTFRLSSQAEKTCVDFRRLLAQRSHSDIQSAAYFPSSGFGV